MICAFGACAYQIVNARPAPVSGTFCSGGVAADALFARRAYQATPVSHG
jgi:hypothetical protein